MARAGGAETIDFSKVKTVYEALMELTSGRGPDSCIDAVGTEAAPHGALDSVVDNIKTHTFLGTDRAHVLRDIVRGVRKGGHLSVPGVYLAGVDKFMMGAFVAKGLTMKSGQTNVQAYIAPLHRRVAKLFAEFAALKEQGADDAKSGLVAQFIDELTVHTAIEEEIFYPAVREAIDDDDLMDEALVEHAGAKQLIAQLRAADPDDDLYDAKVTVLGEQIEHHVEEEEGNMFAQARGADVDMSALGAPMLARKAELLSDRSALSGMSMATSVTSPASVDRKGISPAPVRPRPSAKKKAPRKQATSKNR